MNLDHFLDVEEREQKKVESQNLRRLFSEVWIDRWLVISGLGLVFVGAAAMLLEPWLFGFAIDRAIRPGDSELLGRLVIGFFGVEVLRVGALIGQAYLFEVVGQNTMLRLRLKLFSHLQALPISVYDRNPVGRLVTRVTNDISSVSEMFTSGTIAIFLNVLFVIGSMGAVVYLNWRLGLISIAILPILILLSNHFSKKLRISYRNARSKLSALNAFLAETILGIRSLNLFNRQAIQLRRFSQINEWYAEATIATVKNYAYFQPTITLCSGAAMALVIFFGGRFAFPDAVQAHPMPVGLLSAYFSYVVAMFQPMREIADRWNVFLSGMASAERIFSILDWKTEIVSASLLEPSKEQARAQGHIRFENVWFAYPSETRVEGAEPRWVLKDFNLEITPGMKLGVIGHTGAGKTTLINLLLRFYEPQKGRILIDGRDLRSYDIRTLRSMIGIVQQDVFLFSGSVQENISLWRDPGPEAARKIAESLKDLGYPAWAETGEAALALDERGGNLSMGERQVLAFARAQAKDPSIWIFDEATANIDSDTELKLGQALARATSSRTMIMIAHRLATVRDADLLIVLHKGVVIEQGNHETLMRNAGLYSRMYRYQSAVSRDRTEAKAFGQSRVHQP